MVRVWRRAGPGRAPGRRAAKKEREGSWAGWGRAAWVAGAQDLVRRRVNVSRAQGSRRGLVFSAGRGVGVVVARGGDRRGQRWRSVRLDPGAKLPVLVLDADEARVEVISPATRGGRVRSTARRGGEGVGGRGGRAGRGGRPPGVGARRFLPGGVRASGASVPSTRARVGGCARGGRPCLRAPSPSRAETTPKEVGRGAASHVAVPGTSGRAPPSRHRRSSLRRTRRRRAAAALVSRSSRPASAGGRRAWRARSPRRARRPRSCRCRARGPGGTRAPRRRRPTRAARPSVRGSFSRRVGRGPRAVAASCSWLEMRRRAFVGGSRAAGLLGACGGVRDRARGPRAAAGGLERAARRNSVRGAGSPPCLGSTRRTRRRRGRGR